MINFLDNFISSIFNFLIRILGTRVNIDINDYVDIEIIADMLDLKRKSLKNESNHRSETITLCTLPIDNMETYKELKNKKQLLVGINIGINYILSIKDTKESSLMYNNI